MAKFAEPVPTPLSWYNTGLYHAILGCTNKELKREGEGEREERGKKREGGRERERTPLF